MPLISTGAFWHQSKRHSLGEIIPGEERKSFLLGTISSDVKKVSVEPGHLLLPPFHQRGNGGGSAEVTTVKVLPQLLLVWE